MMDAEITANLYALEQRIYQLEQKIDHMADVGDIVEVECHIHGDIYETKEVVIKSILLKEEKNE